VEARESHFRFGAKLGELGEGLDPRDKAPTDVPILVFNSNEEDEKEEARLDVSDSVSNNIHQVVNDSVSNNTHHVVQDSLKDTEVSR